MVKNVVDDALDVLLALHGDRYVIDDHLGLWVKFEAKRVPAHIRKHGLKYALSLHDKTNKRVLGFDNAHEVEYGGNKAVAPKRTFDHWHMSEKDKGRPYTYKTADVLLEEFWKEVDKKITLMKGGK